MKLSDYRKKRAEHHAGMEEGEIRSRVLAAAVDADVAAAEAAGKVWDPEEEPLPERLEARSYPGSVGPSIWPVGTMSISLSLKSRIYDEAVRRHNAWPELKRIAERLSNVVGVESGRLALIQQDLYTVLDGE